MFLIPISWFGGWGRRKKSWCITNINIFLRGICRQLHIILMLLLTVFRATWPITELWLWFLPRMPTGCRWRSDTSVRPGIKSGKCGPQRYSYSLQRGKGVVLSFHSSPCPWHMFFRTQEEQGIMQESEIFDGHTIILGFGKLRTKGNSMLVLWCWKKWPTFGLKAGFTIRTHFSSVTASNFLSANPK